MSSARFLKPAVLALALTGLGGCVSLLPEAEPVSVYRLSAPEPSQWTGTDWQIVLIERPIAPRGLAGDTIALTRPGQSLAYIHGARWISPAPEVVQDLVIDTFNAGQSGLVPARPGDGVRADFELRLDLREFEAVYDRGEEAAPLVKVRLAARLVSERGRRFVGARVFTAEVRASANRTTAIIAAFDTASMDVSAAISDWSAEIVSELPRPE
ncbi:ABC-type transport auxiliary lipoprotein family protein [Maricaulis parjimensis]|uniref:ABC-type transport auxiliary lipoprotein family protein n=1 Tax=Maricaulis parjimensis TaxID=144023 RepID=UPI00193A8A6D|nr:ABC-type transport auxiliary lipoprotein family protein [Maricaulis parjimensis]